MSKNELKSSREDLMHFKTVKIALKGNFLN